MARPHPPHTFMHPIGPCQEPRDLRHWGSRLYQLVDGLLTDMVRATLPAPSSIRSTMGMAAHRLPLSPAPHIPQEAKPPPPHTLAAHVMAIRDAWGEWAVCMPWPWNGCALL